MENLDNSKKEKRRVTEIEIASYNVNCAISDAIILKILLLSLKLKPDGAMSIRKADMLLKYDTWKAMLAPGF